MRMAEEFERCEKCGQGWFERKEFALIEKGSPRTSEPLTHKVEIQYQCVGCGHTQYKYIKE
jgi:ribosomal protein L44E